MKMIKRLRQTRRDFVAEYECEGCGHHQEIQGYDDRNYYDNVIPELKCEKCKQSTNSLGGKKDFISTVVPYGVEI